ncbi:isoquinoline 1-oxidoreductase beta subunit [Povalibacter uvarum]|uniref:Isoquinoline 1-oxidoreductase beta subunit n=1 Tax=Povalibacter uvarum TaxID=732238 RepID=A0A841HPC7_9GAMM|nr:molybdopterin cofactor-binding domain-containing protein [Povalibacter uvarum]MBB6093785.1 isoquinoline 1-oxidoreductase beta subunit [Povalibacter uvarum]
MTELMLTRRDCLRYGLVGGALLVSFGSHPFAASEGPRPGRDATLGAWIRIGHDDSVTLLTNATEMGQGANTGLAQLLAEELGVEWRDVRIAPAPIEPEYYSMWNEYQTGGSGSVRGMFDKLREAGALARTLLIAAAATRWKVDPAQCRIEGHSVVDATTTRRAGFGSLAADAVAQPAPAKVPLTPREQWRLIGKTLPRFDLPGKIDGSAQYGIDVNVPDMLIAAIAQAPQFGATLQSVDERSAARMPGVVRIVRLPNAVAVVAEDTWSAQRGLQALEPLWTTGKVPNNEQTQAALTSALSEPGTVEVPRDQQEATIRSTHAAAMSSSARRISATYEVPLLAHACMEPMNATAHVAGGKATLWVPTQFQTKTRREVAAALGLTESDITVNTTQLGGGLGRRLEVDYAVQAALIAREIRRPVKLVWSRAEDLQHDFYRQSAMARFEAGLDESGRATALRVRLSGIRESDGWGISRSVYAIPNVLLTNASVPTVLPLGAWRAVVANQNTFFLESFVDEIAHASGTNPLQLRRSLLTDEPRSLRVLNAAVAAAGVENAGASVHFGMAMVRGFGSICAQIVQVSVRARAVRVERVTCAIDCGTAVNPDAVRAQAEGGIALGLSATAYESISVRDGRVVQSNFHDYPLLRFPQMPEVNVVIVDSPQERVGGAGEPPVPPLAPALTNAIFAATGERIRRLPLSASGWTLA